MNKVICDICGTIFSDSAEKCPICGYSRAFGTEELEEDIFLEDGLNDQNPGNIFQPMPPKKKKVFDITTYADNPVPIMRRKLRLYQWTLAG